MKTPTRRELLDHLSGFLTARRLERMREVLDQRTRYLTVVLEDIYQSHNASAVLRSCECFGIQEVHIIENRNAFELNPDVVMGASKWLDLHRYQSQDMNTATCLEALKNSGYRLVAATPHKNDCLLEDLPLEKKTALIFGTEMEGLSETALEMADGFVKIPMRGFTESFNISVSVALTLYHLSKRMRQTSSDWALTAEEKEELLLEWIKKSIKNPEQIIDRFMGFS